LVADIAGIKPSAISATALDSNNGVYEGLIASDPTTPSSQAAGVGNTAWRVNISAGSCVVNSVDKTHTAQGDFAVHGGSLLLADGQSVYAWLVEKNVAGTVSTDVVKGAAATTGQQVAPTDAAVTTALGVSTWIKLARLTLNRTGDAAVTQAQNMTFRQTHMAPLLVSLANELRTKASTAASYTASVAMA
jgi:hypothetical protein